MGILDDAIRQHLELKRQHGVAEEELRRQEEEALGPARRDVAPAQAGDGDAEMAHDQGAAEPAAADQDAAAEQDAPHAAATELLDHETELPAEETELHDPADLHAEPGDALPPPEAAPPTEESPAPEPVPPPEPAPPREPVPHEPFASEHAPAEPVPDEPPASGAMPPEPLDADEPPDHEELRDEDDPVAEQADPEAEDVLEDTPDFLQETPEHDRLWFEQKPPRDFDFD